MDYRETSSIRRNNGSRNHNGVDNMTAMIIDFETYWDALPMQGAGNSKGYAHKAWDASRKATLEEVLHEIEAHREYQRIKCNLLFSPNVGEYPILDIIKEKLEASDETVL